MSCSLSSRLARALVLALILAPLAAPAGQNSRSKKVLMITDMEGVGGIFDSDLQCIPLKSPRWEESRKLLTGEINAAVEGLYEGGATEVIVWDGHSSGTNLSVLDIHPRARLLTGNPVPTSAVIDSSYGALIFIGQHPMAGAEKGVLSHSESEEIQNIWVNNKPTGEIGSWVMIAGAFGIPAVMLSGDTAACKEIRELVPEAECAEVKSGVSRTAAFMLPHPAACALIREKARRAMERLPEFKPYRMAGPVEVKMELTPRGKHTLQPREGVEQVNDRTWVSRGKNIMDAWLKLFD